MSHPTVGVAVTAVTKGVNLITPNDCMTTPPVSQTAKVIWRSQTLPPHLGTPSMGVSLWGVSPLYETGSLKEDHYAKWIIRSTKYEAKATADFRGEEAGASPARLRTETPYKADVARRVGQASRSRSRKVTQVNGELVQETVHALIWGGLSDVPVSRACPKGRAAWGDP